MITISTIADFLLSEWKWLSAMAVPIAALFIQWRSHKSQFEEQLYISRFINHEFDDWYSYKIIIRNNSEHQWDVMKLKISSNPNCRFFDKKDCYEYTAGGRYEFSDEKFENAKNLNNFIDINETIPPVSQANQSIAGSWTFTGGNEFAFVFLFTPNSHRKSKIKLSSKMVLASSKSLRFRKTMTIEKIMTEHMK